MKKITLLAAMLAMMLVMAAPASAQTVDVGDLTAGQLFEDVTVAGTFPPNLPPPGPLPPGTDIAAAGNPIPPSVFANGVNVPGFDEALAGVGAEEDDVVAGSEFLGTDFVEAGFGNLSADTENTFLD